MKTILLLAGRSRRFWPLSDKYLLEIGGKTILEHQLERLKAAGCTDLIIVYGDHNKEAVQRIAGPKPLLIEQKDLDLGMRGALLEALPRCKSSSVLIIGSDLIEPKAYKTLKNKLDHERVDGLLLARKVKRYFPGGYLTLLGRKITGIVEKPDLGKEPSNLVNIVAHIYRDASVLLKALRETKKSADDGYERALGALLKKGRYEAVPYDGLWYPVKYPWHLLELLPTVLSSQKKSIHRSAKVHKSAIIEGLVVVDEGVRILPNAAIVGPAYIGAHTIVGNGALVRGSSIGEHCVIGYNTEVKASVLGDHVWTHSTYIGNSVVGSNVAFGAGSVTGNLRLDEEEIGSAVGEDIVTTGLRKFGTVIGDGVRIGIHVSINPGIKIGRESFVGSAVVISEDVPDGTFVKMVGGEMHVRKNTALALKAEGRKEFRQKLP